MIGNEEWLDGTLRRIAHEMIDHPSGTHLRGKNDYRNSVVLLFRLIAHTYPDLVPL